MEVVVVGDAYPAKFAAELPAGCLKYVEWSPEIEYCLARLFDIGIMPLRDSEWTRGKCSYKMLQYMAAGLPVVVSPVGMNREILGKAECGMAAETDVDWREAVLTLCGTPELRKRLGRNGRALVERSFSTHVIAEKVYALIRSTCNVLKTRGAAC